MTGAASAGTGAPYTVNFTAIDPGDDTISQWTIDWGDGSPIDTVPGYVNFATHIFAASGLSTIVVKATDEDGSYTKSLPITVIQLNNVPISATGLDTVDEGAVYTLSLGANPNTHWQIYWDSHNPQFETVNSATAQVPHTFLDNGLVSVLAENYDSNNVSLGSVFIIVLVRNVAPDVAVAAQVNEGKLLTIPLTAIDPGTDTVTNWTIDWGDGSAWEYFTGGGNSATHTYPNGDKTLPITFLIVDEDGSYRVVKNILIKDVAPTLTLTGPANIDEGAIYALTLGYSDVPADSLLGWTIDWGDGSQDTLGSVSEAFHNYYISGAHQITASAINHDGAFAAAPSAVTVINVTPTIQLAGSDTIAEVATYQLQMDPVSDPGQDASNIVTIDWGDGTTDTWTDGPIGATATHQFADNGLYTIKASVSETNGGVTTSLVAATRQVTVTNVAPVSTIIGPDSIERTALYSGTWTDPIDPGADTIVDQSYTIDAIYPNNGFTPTVTRTGPRSFTLVPNGGGQLDIRISATDEDGTYTLATKSITVRPGSPKTGLTGASTVDEGSLYTLTLTKPIDFTTNQPYTFINSYTVDWGDGKQNTYPTPGPYDATHIYDDGGFAYNIVVDVQIAHFPYKNSATKTVTVNNVAPTAGVSGPASGQSGQPLAFTLTATDPSTSDQSTGFTYGIDWGDGSPIETVNATPGNGAGTPINHTFAIGNAQPYVVQVTATDKDGAPSPAATTSINISQNTTPPLDLCSATSPFTGGADTLTLKVVNGQVVAWVNHDPATDPADQASSQAGLTLISICTKGGTDSITIDGSGGPIGVPIQTDHGSGTDTITFINNNPSAGRVLAATGSLDVTKGTVILASDAGGIALTAENAAVVSFHANQHLFSLKLQDNAKAAFNAGGAKVLRTGDLQISATNSLNLADNDLIVDADPATRDAVLANISDQIKSGRNGGTWDGLGIFSSTAANNAKKITGLAFRINEIYTSTGLNGGSLYTTFDGEPVDKNAVLAKYSYNGDTDLSGKLDADDYFNTDRGFNLRTLPGTLLKGYANGDFDFTNLQDADDYFLIDSAFVQQGGALAATPLGAQSAVSSKNRTSRKNQAVLRRHVHHRQPNGR